MPKETETPASSNDLLVVQVGGMSVSVVFGAAEKAMLVNNPADYSMTYLVPCVRRIMEEMNLLNPVQMGEA